MTTSRKSSSAAFWATVVLVVALVGYPLSFGLFNRMVYNNQLSGETNHRLTIFYGPMFWLSEHGPLPVRQVIEWYCGLCAGIED
jgi:hypothetical protein